MQGKPIMRKPQTQNEGHVKRAVKKLLTKHDYFWWMPPANGFGQSGISDIHAVKRGMFMAIETKFGRRDPTPMQLAFLNSMRAADHFAFVVRDTTLDAFEAFLVYLDKSIEIAGRNEVPPAEVGGPMLDAIKRMADTQILDPVRFAREAKRAAEKKNVRAGVEPHQDGD
jgi:hypothetical protein